MKKIINNSLFAFFLMMLYAMLTSSHPKDATDHKYVRLTHQDSMYVQAFTNLNVAIIDRYRAPDFKKVSGGHYSVKDWGIKGDSSADITAKLQGLINFAQSHGGGEITFDFGKYRQDGEDTIGATGGQITIDAPASQIYNNGVTWVNTQSATIFHGSSGDTAFRNEAYGTTFNNIAIVYVGASHSTGWGLYLHQGGYTRVTNCLFYAFGTPYEIKNGGEWLVDHNYFIYSRNTDGIIIADSTNPDNGDGLFTYNFISNQAGFPTTHALRWNSSGGTRILYNKFNQGIMTCIYAPFLGTIDGQIIGNGAENYTNSFVDFVLPISGTMSNLLIQGNYMDGNGLGGHIVIDASNHNQYLSGVDISGNVFNGTGVDTAILINGGQYINVGINNYAKVGRTVVGTNNNVYTSHLSVSFPSGVQTLSENSNAFVMDLGFGNTAQVTITGNDTLKLFSAFNPITNAPLTNAGFAQGAKFIIKVIQDATGGHNLFVQTYGINYAGSSPFSNAQIGIDSRANAPTIIEGFVNAVGAPYITNVTRYMEIGAIPFMQSNNGIGEDTGRFIYDGANRVLKLGNGAGTTNKNRTFQLYGGLYQNKDSAITSTAGSVVPLGIDTTTGYYVKDYNIGGSGGTGTVTGIATSQGITGGTITTTGTIKADTNYLIRYNDTTGTGTNNIATRSYVNSLALANGSITGSGSAVQMAIFNNSTKLTSKSNFAIDTANFIETITTPTSANTVYPSYVAQNTATASVGNQIYGGFYSSNGNGWSTSNTASRPVSFKWGTVPVQGSANPTGLWELLSSINGSTPLDIFQIDNTGSVIAGGSITSTTSISSGAALSAAQNLILGSHGSMWADSSGTFDIRNTTFAQQLKIYNTWASTSNYEAGVMSWTRATNVFSISTNVGSGGGTARSLELGTGPKLNQLVFNINGTESMNGAFAASGIPTVLTHQTDSSITQMSLTNLAAAIPLATGIVASTDLTSQTGSVSRVVSYTPTANSAFRIGIYTNIISKTGGSLSLNCTYTDVYGNFQTLIFYPMGATSAGLLSTGDVNFPTVDIRAKANTAITVVSTFVGTSITYDVGATITQLR